MLYEQGLLVAKIARLEMTQQIRQQLESLLVRLLGMLDL
jgi:hypothetical protein